MLFAQNPASAPPGTVKGPRWLQFSGWTFEVFWPAEDNERILISHPLKVEDPEPNTYRCPDLLLLPDNEKEETP